MSNELEAELRTYRAQVGSNLELLSLLEAAKDEPGQLLASPSRLLEAQPALRRLKDGLVDAQLRTATVLGTMSPEHPAAKSALAGEQEIGAHLSEEIAIAIKGLQIELRLAQERVAGLERNREDLQNRLLQLANVRAEYSNLVAATRHRSDILKTAQQELAEAHAGQAAARTSSLITLIDQPDAGSKPSGPGRTTVVLGGLMAGLFVAFGIVFLTIQPAALPDSQSQRTEWSVADRRSQCGTSAGRGRCSCVHRRVHRAGSAACAGCRGREPGADGSGVRDPGPGFSSGDCEPGLRKAASCSRRHAAGALRGQQRPLPPSPSRPAA